MGRVLRAETTQKAIGSLFLSLKKFWERFGKVFTTSMSRQTKHFYEFGPFRLDPAEHVLLCDGELVPLTPKAFETLLLLVENSGHVMDKDELMRRVWPDTFVEEVNLAKNISALRKVLGEGEAGGKYIETIPKRGYRFVARVSKVRDEGASPAVGGRFEAESADTEVEESATAIGGARQATEDTAPPVKPAVRSGLFRSLPLILSVGVIAVGLSIAAYFWLTSRAKDAETAAAVRSMAVLPFKLVNPSADDQYLGLGVADDLITKLSNVRQITVRPTSAVLKYTGQDQDLAAADRELGVEAVLAGTIQRSGERVRVTVQLVKVADGAPFWGDRFEEKFTEIFAVQDSISEQVVRALSLRLSREETKLLTKHYTENPEAYQSYLKGRYYWNKRTREGHKKALLYFQEAIERDPNYALAYAGLADAYSFGGGLGLPPKETMPKAKAAAMKALEMDDTLAEAHAALGWIKLRYDFDWSGAEREFKRAIEVNPNYATTYNWYSVELALMGRFDEAIAEAKRAQELEPLSMIINAVVGLPFYFSHQYDRAIAQYRKAIEMDPNFAGAHSWLGLAYEQKGMYEEAVTEFLQARTLAGDRPEKIGALREAYAASGWRGYVRKELELQIEESKEHYVNSYEIAINFARLGEKEQALTWLEKAYEERAGTLYWFTRDPRLDSLRSEPRFQDLLRRVGLPQ